MDNGIFHLPLNDKRKCEITVYADRVFFSGEFWYLRDKEFYRSRAKQDCGLIKNFLGMGYLAKRSYRKTILFVLAGVILELVKVAVDKVTEWLDAANGYLGWLDKSLALPGWVGIVMNVLVGLCLAAGIVLFFSKKKVIEISFTDRRICVPQKSMTQREYQMLYQSILRMK